MPMVARSLITYLLIGLYCLTSSLSHAQMKLYVGDDTVIDTATSPSWSSMTQPHRDAALRSASFSRTLKGPRHWYIQLRGPIQENQRKKLQQWLNASLEMYVPHFAYIVVGRENVAQRAEEHSAVRWVGLRTTKQKMQPLLADESYMRGMHQESVECLRSEVSKTCTPATTLSIRLVSMRVYPQRLMPQQLVQMALDAGRPEVVTVVSNDKLIVPCGMDCDALSVFWASLADTESIEIVAPFKSRNKWASKIVTGGTVTNVDGPWYKNHLYDLGLHGEDQIIGMADTGIDYDHCMFWDADHPDPPFDEVDLSRRKIVSYIRQTGSTCGKPVGTLCGDRFDDLYGHGTHMAASIAGQALTPVDNAAERLAADPYNGVAFASKIHFTDIGINGILSPPIDLNAFLFPEPYAAGARIFSNSWGCAATPTDNCADYRQADSEVDRFMWEHKDFLVIFAAGDEGKTAYDGTVRSPAIAKNVLTVGASENIAQAAIDAAKYVSPSQQLCPGLVTDPSCCPLGCTGSDCCAADKMECCDDPVLLQVHYAQSGLNNLAADSSRGFTRDGRIKPDIVAPGSRIVSAQSDARAHTNGNGKVQCGFEAAPGEPFDPQSALRTGTSTSSAAAVVAGAVALVRQYFLLGFYPEARINPDRGFVPSSALMKAALVSSSESLTGRVVLGSYPATVEEPCCASIPLGATSGTSQFDGFGSMHLANVLRAPDSPFSLFIDDNFNGIVTTEKAVYVFDGVDMAYDFAVTLAWTDYPGNPFSAGQTPVLINDLDITVDVLRSNSSAFYDQQTFYPNNGTSADRLNTVERVRINHVDDGGLLTLQVTVSAFNVAVIVGFESQQFAIVATGRWDSAVLSEPPPPHSNPGYERPIATEETIKGQAQMVLPPRAFITLFLTVLATYLL